MIHSKDFKGEKKPCTIRNSSDDKSWQGRVKGRGGGAFFHLSQCEILTQLGDVYYGLPNKWTSWITACLGEKVKIK